jgi:hypothetical protein
MCQVLKLSNNSVPTSGCGMPIQHSCPGISHLPFLFYKSYQTETEMSGVSLFAQNEDSDEAPAKISA